MLLGQLNGPLIDRRPHSLPIQVLDVNPHLLNRTSHEGCDGLSVGFPGVQEPCPVQNVEAEGVHGAEVGNVPGPPEGLQGKHPSCAPHDGAIHVKESGSHLGLPAATTNPRRVRLATCHWGSRAPRTRRPLPGRARPDP